jgi:L-alanine-DL-glutamate epimerase-like enolase superfamily enzyme
MTQFTINVAVERRPLARPFVIARGTITDVEFVTVSLSANGVTGRGESCPVPHFGESVAGVVALAREWAAALADGKDWPTLHDRVTAGAARNAIDCAWWDWRAKSEARPAWALLGLPKPELTTTAFTIGIDTPDTMGNRASAAAKAHQLLKVKLGAPDDLARIRAVRAAAPDATLIADANEGWSPAEFAAAMRVLVECGYAMLEQPFPAGQDRLLHGVERRLPIAADESCHVAADVARIAPFYDMVNVKLDKTGGMTEAVRLLDAAQAAGLDAMVGCMLGTSLAMAPALLLAGRCRYADLDAPLLMGSDRDPALTYRDGTVAPPSPALWG